MDSNQIRESYLKFFQDKGHALIPAAPLVPADDPTTLFTSSGMQQLVPYLKGQAHPMGKRLADSQPCFRAEDIDQAGDNRHTNFFTMLGNWSLGDYFKAEQLAWFWEWLTKILKLDTARLYVTVFSGSKEVAKDEESFTIWRKIGLAKDHIFYYPANKNWWSRSGAPEKMPLGEIGGQDSEVFYEFKEIDHNLKFGSKCHPNCECGRFLEIGNSVFMEYEKTKAGFRPLPYKNVDFGGGLERLTAASQNQPDIFQTDIFKPLMSAIKLESISDQRLVADHLRAASAMLKEGILPSNKKQGYILRRLIRRAAVKFSDPAELTQYNSDPILNEEINKFSRSLQEGKRLLQKAKIVDENFAFNLYQSYGLPFEVITGLTKTKLDAAKFNQLLTSHSQKSRTASAGMFKAGLADHSEQVTKCHTATHLLQAALRQVLGTTVCQEGSNITGERLRFDFSHPKALTQAELQQVEALVNQKILENLAVTKAVMTKEAALQSGALAFFKETYPEKVSVYTIGNFSKEICSGPHIRSTGAIGRVKLVKQEAIGAGKRRLYAVVEK